MSHRFHKYLAIAAFAIVCTFVSLFAQANYSIDEVTLSSDKANTTIVIKTSDKAEYNKSTMGNPPRLVIDLTSAMLNLPQKEYSKMPPGVVVSVRASQTGGNCRIVFDLADDIKAATTKDIEGGFSIQIPSSDYTPIANWTSGSKGTSPVPKKSAAAAPETPETPAEQPAAPETPKQEPFASENIPPELAIYMHPETLSYKGVIADKETIEVAKYIRNMVIFSIAPRDPFVRPSRNKELPLGKEPLPNIDELTIVGIVKSGASRIAISQDKKGFGYVITVGDSVESGICVAITDTTARFEVVEYEQLRRIELPLVKPNKNLP
jgi:hypothetical protein